MSAATITESFAITSARQDVARYERRLRRAQGDLAKALDRQERVEGWEPGLATSLADLTEWRIAAADRVRDLRVRVKVRQGFVADAHRRLADRLDQEAGR